MNYHPPTDLAQIGQTFIFAGVNVVAACLLLSAAPARRFGGAPSIWLRTLVPAFALFMIFLAASLSAIADRALLQIDTLRIPLASVVTVDDETPSSNNDVYFFVGDQVKGSDLVVAPYPDENRSQQVLGPDTRPLVTLHASRDGGNVSTRFCRYAYPADEATALPGMIAQTGDANIASSASTTVECQPLLTGEVPQTVFISRVDAANGVLTKQIRRELTIKRRGIGADDALVVRLATPLAVDLGNCTRPNMRLMPNAALPPDPEYLPADNLVIPQLGAGGAYPLLVPAALGQLIADDNICDARQIAFQWPKGNAGDARLSGQIKRTFLPSFPVMLVLISSLILYGFCARTWSQGGAAECVIFALQWLLLIRIIVGVGGLYAQPTVDSAAVMWDITLAYVCIPMIAVALLMPRDDQTFKTLGGLCLYLGLAVISIGLWLGVPPWLDAKLRSMVPVFLILLTAATLGMRAAIKNEVPLLQQFWNLIASALWGRDPWCFGWQLLLSAICIRLILAFLGFVLSLAGIEQKLSESIGPLRLSLFYVPATIIGFAALLAGFRRHPSANRMAIIVTLFVIAYFGIAVAVRDFGIVFVFAWPVGAAIAAFGLGVAVRQRKFVSAAGIILPLMAPFSLFLLAWHWGEALIPAPVNNGGLVAHLEAVKDWDDNYVRLLRFARPDRVEELGTRSAFKTLEQAASLDPLGRTLVGNGYLVSANVRDPLIRYQYLDNLSAIHIMWPFGRVGMISLLIFLYLIANSLRPSHGSEEEMGGEVDMRALVGHMATATLMWAGIYMTLANLNLVPFTGRNIYLLAVTSGSDLLEGLALMMLAALPWLSKHSLAKPESEAR